MKIKDNQNNTLFNPDTDYETPSEDRPYVFKVGKTLIYVNLEQLRFLREDYWQEKTENWKKSRCLIPAERGELKICKQDCTQCQWFLSFKTLPTYTSLTDMDEEEFLENNQQESIVDILEREEQTRLMYEAIDHLEDPIDRFIMRQYLLEVTDGEVAKKLKKTRQTIINRRKQCIDKMKNYIKNL